MQKCQPISRVLCKYSIEHQTKTPQTHVQGQAYSAPMRMPFCPYTIAFSKGQILHLYRVAKVDMSNLIITFLVPMLLRLLLNLIYYMVKRA